ncbi:unnamed protein product [Lampetra planeri]
MRLPRRWPGGAGVLRWVGGASWGGAELPGRTTRLERVERVTGRLAHGNRERQSQLSPTFLFASRREETCSSRRPRGLPCGRRAQMLAPTSFNPRSCPRRCRWRLWLHRLPAQVRDGWHDACAPGAAGPWRLVQIIDEREFLKLASTLPPLAVVVKLRRTAKPQVQSPGAEIYDTSPPPPPPSTQQH